ncbi:MAG: hypothetical protein HC789_01450 [Microcoleus sp. CSU_2_2]|nr:hypothetical protein [Microcoleus sp. SU_5_3]NJS09124.1 hypothetical protein [Microcoleus sp. CSU_2_2]
MAQSKCRSILPPGLARGDGNLKQNLDRPILLLSAIGKNLAPPSQTKIVFEDR